MICSFGCNQNAEFTLKTGRLCCSKSPNSCPGKRLRDSLRKTGKRLTSSVKRVPWNKGKQFKNDVRWKGRGTKAALTRIGKGQIPGQAATEEAERIRRSSISKSMKSNPKAGGLREGSGRGQKTWYISPIAGKVYLRSSYELAYAKYLDECGVSWRQNDRFFWYSWGEEMRKYYPDFYLVSEDCYVEVKGYETEKDRAKWRSFPHKLKVLRKHDLVSLNII